MSGGGQSDRAETRDEEVVATDLVSRFQSGDKEAFAKLYSLYFDRVYSYLRVVLGNGDIDDAAQQVFIKVFEALPRYEHRGRPFAAWLFTVVRNHALLQRERTAREDVLAPAQINKRRERASVVEEPELIALHWITDKDLLFLIKRLPLPQRQAVAMRCMLDFSNADIAAVLDRRPDDVRLLQHRAFSYLRDRLIALGRTPEQPRNRTPWRRRPRAAPVLRNRRFALYE